jgi:hypothetical protein
MKHELFHNYENLMELQHHQQHFSKKNSVRVSHDECTFQQFLDSLIYIKYEI